MDRRSFIKLFGISAVFPSLPSLEQTETKPLPNPVQRGTNRKDAREQLGKWLREKMDEDMIYALSGLRRT